MTLEGLSKTEFSVDLSECFEFEEGHEYRVTLIALVTLVTLEQTYMHCVMYLIIINPTCMHIYIYIYVYIYNRCNWIIVNL